MFSHISQPSRAPQVKRIWAWGQWIERGEISIRLWDLNKLKFTTAHTVLTAHEHPWELLPRCCGRGAACPHLRCCAPEQRWWSNGDRLDLSLLTPIPTAFRKQTQLPGSSAQKRAKLEASLPIHLRPSLLDLAASEPDCPHADLTGVVSGPDCKSDASADPIVVCEGGSDGVDSDACGSESEEPECDCGGVCRCCWEMKYM